ncbi:hypothetical protein PIB30_099547 [Stylosanthes scabra]|uniref:Uncharacterized protein n=1 Tax=Stylosanthes scabra TaxID=79078 RepID=A0ABU6ZVN4_9FABA|nr:hypothetical protein [Stylosanthes scabra]
MLSSPSLNNTQPNHPHPLPNTNQPPSSFTLLHLPTYPENWINPDPMSTDSPSQEIPSTLNDGMNTRPPDPDPDPAPPDFGLGNSSLLVVVVVNCGESLQNVDVERQNENPLQIIFSWNTRGVANDATIRSLKEYLRTYKPTLIILLETRCSGAKRNEILRKIGLRHSVVVDAEGFCSGPKFTWKGVERDRNDRVYKRLDHALANVEWRTMF